MDSEERARRENRVGKALDDLEIDWSVVHHEPVFTVEESKMVRGRQSGAHLKNLFLCCRKKRRFFLLIALEHKRVDLKALTQTLAVRSGLRFANETHLNDQLGVRAGAVSPFALLNDEDGSVGVIVDRDIFDAALVNAHPLHNEATFTFSSDALKIFLNSTVPLGTLR